MQAVIVSMSAGVGRSATFRSLRLFRLVVRAQETPEIVRVAALDLICQLFGHRIERRHLAPLQQSSVEGALQPRWIVVERAYADG